MSGASLAGLSGFTGVNPVSAEKTETVGMSDLSAEPDTPSFAGNQMVGYAKGTYNNPVTPGTIRELQNTVLRNQPDSREIRSAMVHDPTAEPGGQSADIGNEKHVIGYGIKWQNDSPHILIKYGPEKQDLPSEAKATIETNAHKDMNEFVAGKVGGSR